MLLNHYMFYVLPCSIKSRTEVNIHCLWSVNMYKVNIWQRYQKDNNPVIKLPKIRKKMCGIGCILVFVCVYF